MIARAPGQCFHDRAQLRWHPDEGRPSLAADTN
eukprot:CAMPEP_0183559598 /NCGR_PEP_ID=MMETSP0371-20130417/92262_1 /TAXON_ID=268820 /ORGANISM="Peridinium aciculiferum, Strain PAER-2" /LENGTH=32 /DNA_ID= /DNA_START= /DNA_END= /DNA_ORIENTATION=